MIYKILMPTDDIPTPVRTPRFLTSHHKNAPTSPAAPVPDAKYLVDRRQINFKTEDGEMICTRRCDPIVREGDR